MHFICDEMKTICENSAILKTRILKLTISMKKSYTSISPSIKPISYSKYLNLLTNNTEMYVHYVQKHRLRLLAHILGATDQKFTILYTHKLDDIPLNCILQLTACTNLLRVFDL